LFRVSSFLKKFITRKLFGKLFLILHVGDERTKSVRKVVHIIFFTNQGLVLQIAEYVNGKFFRWAKKTEEILQQTKASDGSELVSGYCTTTLLATRRPFYVTF
jgi:hypothetical protein